MRIDAVKKLLFQSLFRFVSTVPRCHAVGASLAIGAIFATAWVWSVGHSPILTVTCGDETIDIGEAKTLVENADQWRELYTVSFREQERLDQRVKAIAGWLPEAVEFKQLEESLLALGEDSALHVFSVQEGKRHVGSRVGVLTLSCETQGSFSSLCRFLHELPQLSTPVACSELKLQRLGAGLQVKSDVEWSVDQQPCRATLFLRVPYAAPETTSWKLLKEQDHAI